MQDTEGRTFVNPEVEYSEEENRIQEKEARKKFGEGGRRHIPTVPHTTSSLSIETQEENSIVGPLLLRIGGGKTKS